MLALPPPEPPPKGWWTLLAEARERAEFDEWVEGVAAEVRARRRREVELEVETRSKAWRAKARVEGALWDSLTYWQQHDVVMRGRAVRGRPPVAPGSNVGASTRFAYGLE
jgi:hypothetical protein